MAFRKDVDNPLACDVDLKYSLSNVENKIGILTGITEFSIHSFSRL